MPPTDRTFRAVAQEQPETVVALLRVVTPELVPAAADVTPEEIDASFFVAPPALDADWIARVGDDLALHVECQGYHDASFPERLARYHMAAALRYPRRHVRTIALWVIRPPDRHRLEEVELTGVRVSVTAVVLPEIPAELLLRDPRAACFAIGADPGRWSDEELGQRVAHALRQHGASERELALAVALSLTAGRYDAMVNAMKESELGSVVLEEFVRFGEDRGELRMARQNVLDVLAARGLAADEDTLHRIQQETSVERLRVLLRRAAVAATPTELFDPGDAPP